MNAEEHAAEAIRLAEERGAQRACDTFARQMMVGPFDDRGVARPGEEHGDGFAILIGGWRIGWFRTREEACEAAQRFASALRFHGDTPAPSRAGKGDE